MRKITYNITGISTLIITLIICVNLLLLKEVNSQSMTFQISQRIPSNIVKLTTDWINKINASPRRIGLKLSQVRTSQLAGLLQKTARGEITGAWVRLNDSPGRMQWSQIFMAPGLKGSSALLSSIMWRLHKSFFMNLNDFNKLEVMAFLVLPPDTFRFSKNISGLTKFNKFKVRCVLNECSRYLNQLGIRTRSLIDEKVESTINNNGIIGMFIPSLQEDTVTEIYKKYSELTPFILTSPISWQRQAYALVISSEIWNKLSPSLKRFVLENSGEKLSASFGTSIDISNLKYIKESYPFLSAKKIDWSIDDLIRLKKESDKYRNNIVNNASPKNKNKLRNAIKILGDIEQ